MGRARINPPQNALAEIESLALKGYSTTGIAKQFKVARSVVMRWFEEDERFEEAYEQGRDAYRQALEEQIVAMTLAGKNCAGMIYLLKAKFKMYDIPTPASKLDVAVNVAQPVMIVRDCGTDEEWQAKAIAQQKKITESSQSALPAPSEPRTYPPALEAPGAAPVAADAPFDERAWAARAGSSIPAPVAPTRRPRF